MDMKVKARDMTGTGRYPPTPRFQPLSFYSAVRLSDPEMLSKVMAVDPYFVTQDNGMGAPVHFATTYCRLDMLHHLLNQGAEVNQKDSRGLTPLHRAAHLAHLDGYLEIYEYLLSRGADPSMRTAVMDEYLDPDPKLPIDMAANGEVAAALHQLEECYAAVPKAREPHPYIGDWWTLYDYGLDAIKQWPVDYEPDFPEDRKRKRAREAKAARKAERKALKAQFLQALADGRQEDAVAIIKAANNKASGAVTAAASVKQIEASVQAVQAVKPFTAFLFPGQGSQAVGMLQETCSMPVVQDMLRKAEQILGYDLLERCLTGPKELLDSTEVAQPALLVASLAAAHRLAQQDPGAVAACSAVAGLSVGEYAALVWSGALSFEDGLKVVKARGEAMSAAARQGTPHTMLSVVGLEDDVLQQLCKQVLSQVSVPEGTVCQVANLIFPAGWVVSGHTAALDLLKDLAMGAGALKAQMVSVSGAFHTRLMQPAQDALAKVLAIVTISAPKVPVYSNVTAQPFPADPQAIRELLARQLVEPVQWEATLASLISSGKGAAGGTAKLYELGPGQQIKAMVRRMDAASWRDFSNVAA